MKMAAKKRAQIMAQMATMQNNFMKKNAKIFEEAAMDIGCKSTERGSAMDLSEAMDQSSVALGPHQTSRLCQEETYTCILCQEEQSVKANEPAMVLAAFVQQSTVLCQQQDRTQEPTPLFLSANLGASPHASTCGHVMHSSCWQKYFDNVLAKENRRPYRLRQPASFDVEKHEYLCPLCECLSNTVMPVLPPLGLMQPSLSKQPEDLTFDMWLDIMKSIVKCKGERPKRSVDLEMKDTSCRYCRFLAQAPGTVDIISFSIKNRN